MAKTFTWTGDVIGGLSVRAPSEMLRATAWRVILIVQPLIVQLVTWALYKKFASEITTVGSGMIGVPRDDGAVDRPCVSKARIIRQLRKPADDLAEN